MVMAHGRGLNTRPVTVAELGPGDSPGVGMAALLSGSERYWALDVVSYSNPERNVQVFDALLDLFTRRASIPDESDLAEVQPALDTYAFPGHVLTEERLRAALAPERVARLREAVRALGTQPTNGSTPIEYMVSWQDATRVRPGSVDVILSQAVLEHVDDVPGTYEAMRAWLRPGGYMSHQVDFRCHGTSSDWNGHWTVSDLNWSIAKGRREYFLNREPCSRHLRLMSDLGFTVVREDRQRDQGGIGRASLAPRFRHLTDDDLRTCGVFVQAVNGTNGR
jgi:SAM-dependent methyltransferase